MSALRLEICKSVSEISIKRRKAHLSASAKCVVLTAPQLVGCQPTLDWMGGNHGCFCCAFAVPNVAHLGSKELCMYDETDTTLCWNGKEVPYRRLRRDQRFNRASTQRVAVGSGPPNVRITCIGRPLLLLMTGSRALCSRPLKIASGLAPPSGAQIGLRSHCFSCALVCQSGSTRLDHHRKCGQQKQQ